MCIHGVKDSQPHLKTYSIKWIGETDYVVKTMQCFYRILMELLGKWEKLVIFYTSLFSSHFYSLNQFVYVCVCLYMYMYMYIVYVYIHVYICFNGSTQSFLPKVRIVCKRLRDSSSVLSCLLNLRLKYSSV